AESATTCIADILTGRNGLGEPVVRMTAAGRPAEPCTAGLSWRPAKRDITAGGRAGSEDKPGCPAVSGADAKAGAALRAAQEDRDSVVELTRQLVRVPSRAGIDPYRPVLECMSAWLDGHGLRPRRLLAAGGETVAMVCEITGGRSGPRYVLDACLDTAPFGNEAAWTYPPTSGAIDGGWLHGRGACDSKAGAAIFAHVAARLLPVSDQLAGSLVLLFDVDEHTGRFGGARAYFEGADAPDRVDGVMIGYPGPDHVVTGGRGVLRARLRVHGIASHSGSRTT